MSDLTQNIRRQAALARAPGHRVPSTGHLNQDQPRLDTAANAGAEGGAGAVIADYLGITGPAQRQQGNDFQHYPQARAEIRGYSETLIKANVSGAVEINCNRANVFDLTLVANVSITLTIPEDVPDLQVPEGAPRRKRAHGITLILRQDASGARNVVWPASLYWPGGGAMVLSTAAQAIDMLILLTTDRGLSWFAMEVGTDFRVLS
jgi:hypothetical protein